MMLLYKILKKYGLYLLLIWAGLSLSVFYGDALSKIFAQIPYYAILLIALPLFAKKILQDNGGGKFRGSMYLVIVLVLVPVISIIQIVLYSNYRDFSTGNTTVGYLFGVYLVILTSIFLGVFISSIRFQGGLVFHCVFLSVLLVQWYGMLSDGLLIDWIGFNDRKNTDEFVSHLAMELPLTLLLVYYLSISRNYYKYLVFIVSIAVLWSIGGRTLLFSFILAFFLLGILERNARSLVISALSGVLFLSFYALIIESSDNPFVARMLLLDGIAFDQSGVSREQFYNFAIKTIDNYLFFGNVNFYAEHFGDFGAYSHNIISFVQFFGFFFLLFCTYVVVNSLKTMINFVRADPESPKAYFGLFLLVLSVLGILSGKYVGSALLWAALGFCLTVDLKSHRD